MASDTDERVSGVVNFPKGKVLFKQGETADAAYIVNAGAVGMYRESQGRKIPLATVRRGELYGEMAAVDASPRMATAFTLEDSTLMVIPIDAMVGKLGKTDPFIRSLITMLANNLRGVHDAYMPKSRTITDALSMLARQADVITRFLQNDLPGSLRADLTAKLAELDGVVKELRRLAAAHREGDRREDAVPTEAQLPQ